MASQTDQKPKYVNLAERLRREIHSGKMKPGDRLPPYGEAQQRYGTTKATLDRAHAVLEQDGLIVRRPGSGVYVAQAQRGPRTGLIGIIHAPTEGQGGFPGAAHSSYESHLLHAVRATAHRQGVDVLLLHPKPSPGWEKVDGVLAHGHGAEFILGFGARIPTVAMLHTIEGVPSVVADDYSGARQATEHLISLGHQRIGYLLDTSAGNPLSQQRLAGYQDALCAVGIGISPDWVGQLKNYGPMHKRGLVSMREWLQRGFLKSGCTAALVQNDLAAIGAMEALREAGVLVPRDISVIGFDSTNECELISPQLTSVHVPLEEIGARAAELLLRQINEEEVSLSTVTFPTHLVMRQTTAPLSRTRNRVQTKISN